MFSSLPSLYPTTHSLAFMGGHLPKALRHRDCSLGNKEPLPADSENSRKITPREQQSSAPGLALSSQPLQQPPFPFCVPLQPSKQRPV